MRASLNNFRGSPRRFNKYLVAVRGLNAVIAVEKLKFLTSPYAQSLKKLISSAIANATFSNANLQPSSLIVSEGTVGRGTFLKRVCFRGRGKTGRVTKFASNVQVILKEKEDKGKEV